MSPADSTGTRDEHYDLLSVLYHALHGAENCEIYAVDAEAAAKDELAAFFREVQGMQAGVAERAKGLLGILEGAPEVGRYSAGTLPSGTGAPPGDVPTTPDAAPGMEPDPTGPLPAGGGVPTGGVPPRTAQSGWETPPPRPRRASPAETAPPGEDVAPPAEAPRRAVPPDAPRTEEPPPRTGDAPPSPSESPPSG